MRRLLEPQQTSPQIAWIQVVAGIVIALGVALTFQSDFIHLAFGLIAARLVAGGGSALLWERNPALSRILRLLALLLYGVILVVCVIYLLGNRTG